LSVVAHRREGVIRMGRVLPVLTVGLALLFATACGGGDDGNGDGGGGADVVDTPGGGSEGATGTASVEQTCADIEEVFRTVDGGDEARDALFDAADAGDEAATEEARAGYLEFAHGFAERLRDVAESAADEGLRSALEVYADEFEALAAEVAAEPTQRDSLEPTSTFEAAGKEVNETCGF
jgi:hypothetical protein